MKSSKSSPELDFSQISLISSVVRGNLKAVPVKAAFSSSGDPTCSALLFVLDYDILWLALSLTPAMSDVKEKKPRSRAPAHVWTAGVDEANNFFYAC